MKFKNILLLLPREGDSRYKVPLTPQAGIGYISHSLQKSKISHQVIDMNLGYNTKDLFQLINHEGFDLVGIGMRSFGFKTTYNLIRTIKNHFSNLKIVVGGPHVSTMREQVLLDCSEIDYGIVLEGEETIIELMNGKDDKDIKGLIYKEDNKICFTGNRKFIQDLDKNGFPKYEKFQLNKYIGGYISIVSSRGCPFNCIYCPVEKSMGKKFRERSAENVLEEILYWYKKGYKKFDFADDNFTLNRNRTYKICDLILQSGMKNLILSCQNGIRADKVDYELLKKMKRSGFRILCFGVESGNDQILENIEKGETLEQIEKAVRYACELGFEVKLFFIIGSPGETLPKFMDSINLAKKYPVTDVTFYNLIPFPATKLIEWADHKGFLTRQPDDYLNSTSHFLNDPLIETPEFTIKNRKRAFKLALKVSAEIRRKGYQRLLNERYGEFFARIASIILCSEIYQNLYSKFPGVRQIAEKAKERVRL